MRDFNFFSPYIDIKRARRTHTQYATLAGALVICILAGLMTWSIYTVKTLEREISDKEKFLNSTEVKQSLAEYENLMETIGKLEQYYGSVITVDDAINKRDILSTSTLDSIAAAMPKDAFLQSVSGEGDSIELVCITSGKDAVAELERNLKAIADIDKVHVVGTKNVNGYYTSGIKIKIKEVAISEAD